MLRALSGLSLLLGAHRRTVRRIGALCLVFIGVHAGADVLDGALARLLDAIDLAFDEVVAGGLAALADAGGMSQVRAAGDAEAFAAWLDLGAKERLAQVLALAVELCMDGLLVPLAWGRHTDFDGDAADVLRGSGRALLDTLWPIDIERLAVVPAVAVLAVAGAASAGLAFEGVARAVVESLVPGAGWVGLAAACSSILAAALLVWRFVPDLTQGALCASQARAVRAHRSASEGRLPSPRFPRAQRAFATVRRGLRGAVVAAVALPLAAAAAGTDEIKGLIARMEAGTE